MNVYHSSTAPSVNFRLFLGNSLRNSLRNSLEQFGDVALSVTNSLGTRTVWGRGTFCYKFKKSHKKHKTQSRNDSFVSALIIYAF